MHDQNDDLSELDWIALSGKRAKGRRPGYFEDPAIDRLLSIVMALVGEVSVLRERSDTLERLIEQHGLFPQNEIENYLPDPAAAKKRGEATMAYISRVMRGVQQDVEAMRNPDAPVEEVADKLGKM